ncbi:MAG TPA: hypothetical protein VE127_02105 [Solirubrobacteraceae bacterium]|jgi:transcriptional regulator GlxA family with amidase domain|nr:hypothetical protein [Solirubrobacteraceae bacterium]
MGSEELSVHVMIISAGGLAQARELTSSIVASCWPGGTQDRIDPAALGWLRRWRPRSATALPTCTCETGRCRVCN